MSIKIISLILNDHTPTFTPTEKLVLIKLADCAQDDGSRVFPSINTIMKSTGLSRRSVLYTINALGNKQALRLCDFYAFGPHIKRPNVYQINVPLLEALQKSPERKEPKKNPRKSRKVPVDNHLVTKGGSARVAPPPVQELHPILHIEPSVIKNTVGKPFYVDKWPPPNMEVANKHLRDEALSSFIKDCQDRGIEIPKRYDYLTERLAA